MTEIDYSFLTESALYDADVRNKSNHAMSHGSNEPWSEPEAMPTSLSAVPDLDINLLPESIRAWVADIAYRQGCAIEFPAVTALSHMGSIIGRKVCVRPTTNSHTWSEVPNLWGGIISTASSQKSPAIEEARKPFKRVQERLQEDAERELKPLREEYGRRKAELTAENKDIAKCWSMLKTGKNSDDITADHLNDRAGTAQIEEDELEALFVKAYAPRILETQDATLEALQQALTANPNGVMYFNDELSEWIESLRKQGRETQRKAFLEMANGTGTRTSDRIGRGHSEFNTIVTLFGGIQPAPMAEMVKEALSDNKAKDGLLPRFRLLVWCSIPDTAPNDTAPDANAILLAEDAFLYLYEHDPIDRGARDADIPYLRFTEAAQEVWWAYYLELRKRARDLNEALASHLLKYPTLICGLALIDHVSAKRYGDITLETLERAIRLSEWLWYHAIRIYSSTGNSERQALRTLCERIADGKLGDKFTARTLKKKGWQATITDNAEDLLHELEEMSWIARVESAAHSVGRPTSVYRVNPKVMK